MEVEKPDAIWIMTDPRFYSWLIGMSDEIKDRGIPILYYHVWDEFPIPEFNKDFYDSCDYVGCISKLTHSILTSLNHADCGYIPHAVDKKVFRPFSTADIAKHKAAALGSNKDKFMYFYNSRNARRKMTSDVIKTFKETLDVVGQDKAFLLLHSDPHDLEGANLLEVCKLLGLRQDQIAFSNQRVPPEQMAIFYNIADCTVNLSNNEGFGLSSLESLMCGTPVISVRTGGLQDQNYDAETGKEYGVSIYPKVKSLTGSQQIPYIFDCRCADEDILAAYLKMYNMTQADIEKLGQECAEHARKLFKLDDMVNSWDGALSKKIKEYKEHGNKNRIKFTKI
jgi:glycosyltransferase involved in cell wall biosynthesis